MFGFGKAQLVQKISGTTANRETLITAIRRASKGERVLLKPEDWDCRETIIAWNDLINKMCVQRQDALLEVNRMVAEITKMEYVKD